MGADSPDVVIAKRLLDHLKLCGFQFRRTAPGEDAPLVGNRVTGDRIDMIHIEGFSRDCFAWRKRTSSLIVPGDALVEHRTTGNALNVLKTGRDKETVACTSRTYLRAGFTGFFPTLIDSGFTGVARTLSVKLSWDMACAAGPPTGIVPAPLFAAGLVVLVSLCSLFVVQAPIFRALAGGAAMVVAVTLAAAWTLLPAADPPAFEHDPYHSKLLVWRRSGRSRSRSMRSWPGSSSGPGACRRS